MPTLFGDRRSFLTSILPAVMGCNCAESAPSRPSYPPVRSLNTQPFYTDAENSIVSSDKLDAERTATKPLTTFVNGMQLAAERWLLANDAEAAAWALSQFSNWADAGALLGLFSEQGKAARRFNLTGLALAFLALRKATKQSETEQIGSWLRNVALACLEDERRLQNNHLNWLSAATISCSLAAREPSLYRHGISLITQAINKIQSDGSIVSEVLRGKRSLYYHSFTLGPTLLAGELAHSRGDNLYIVNGAAIGRLFNFVVNNIHNPEELASLASAQQLWAATTQNTVPWLELAARTQRSSWLKAKLAQLRPIRYSYLGGNQTALWTSRDAWLLA